MNIRHHKMIMKGKGKLNAYAWCSEWSARVTSECISRVGYARRSNIEPFGMLVERCWGVIGMAAFA